MGTIAQGTCALIAPAIQRFNGQGAIQSQRTGIGNSASQRKRGTSKNVQTGIRSNGHRTGLHRAGDGIATHSRNGSALTASQVCHLQQGGVDGGVQNCCPIYHHTVCAHCGNRAGTCFSREYKLTLAVIIQAHVAAVTGHTSLEMIDLFLGRSSCHIGKITGTRHRIGKGIGLFLGAVINLQLINDYLGIDGQVLHLQVPTIQIKDESILRRIGVNVICRGISITIGRAGTRIHGILARQDLRIQHGISNHAAHNRGCACRGGNARYSSNTGQQRATKHFRKM